MKKITLITAVILIFSSAYLGANGFKEGNKLYLGGKYQDALNQYQDFIQKNPEYYEGYFNAGNALFRQEQYDSALGMYKKAQELNPKDADVQYNIDVTEQKLKEKQDESQKSKGKSQKEDQNKQQGQNQQGKNGQQGGEKKSQDSSPKAQEGQKGQQAQQGQKGNQGSGIRDSESKKQPPSGMTEDEVQAFLNQKQNQEKQLQGYFGKQNRKQNQEPDMFNMSPEQIMQYMMQRQMDPFTGEPQQKQQGGGNEKDW
jgi:Ca-activated chloride channel homolog